jgi:AraC family transcriptional regulator of adaptative response / DNA-3-methyladenine glycosylase II
MHQKDVQPENQYLFHLRFRPPYDWKGMLDFFALRAIPGVEAVEGGEYRRTISVNGAHGHFAVSLNESGEELAVRLQIGEPSSLIRIVERIR